MSTWKFHSKNKKYQTCKIHCCADWDSQTLFYNSLAIAEW